MKTLSSFVGLRALSKFVSMGEVLPLRWRGGCAWLLPWWLVCLRGCVQRTGNRVEGPANSRYPKHSLAWGPRAAQEAVAQPLQPCVMKLEAYLANIAWKLGPVPDLCSG